LLVSTISYIAIFGALVLLALVAVQVGRNYRRRYLAKTEERVDALYLRITPERLWLTTLIGATVGALVLALVSRFNWVMVVLGAIGGFFVPRLYLSHMEQQRRRKFEAQLVDAVALVAGAMQSGMSLLQALERVTREMGRPIKQEFAYALKVNQVGKPIMQALDDMKNRIRSEDLTITVNAINIALETGGVLSEVLLKIAGTIRERNRMRTKITTMTAQGQLQGMVMSLMPWALAGLMYLLDRSLMGPMFTHTLGQVIIGVIVVLEILGWLVIRKLVAVDV
jgi:tight adherence protein B